MADAILPFEFKKIPPRSKIAKLLIIGSQIVTNLYGLDKTLKQPDLYPALPQNPLYKKLLTLRDEWVNIATIDEKDAQ